MNEVTSESKDRTENRRSSLERGFKEDGVEWMTEGGEKGGLMT